MRKLLALGLTLAALVPATSAHASEATYKEVEGSSPLQSWPDGSGGFTYVRVEDYPLDTSAEVLWIGSMADGSHGSIAFYDQLTKANSDTPPSFRQRGIRRAHLRFRSEHECMRSTGDHSCVRYGTIVLRIRWEGYGRANRGVYDGGFITDMRQAHLTGSMTFDGETFPGMDNLDLGAGYLYRERGERPPMEWRGM